MIWLSPLVPILMVLFVAVCVARSSNGERHKRCLANTARLERELGIGRVAWEVRGEPMDYELGPGVVWRVDDPAAIGYLSKSAPPAAQKWGVEHGMVYEEEAREAEALMIDMESTARAITSRRRAS